MKTLDRYIARYFLINFAILLVVFTVLFVLVDLIVDMDEFVRAGRERSEAFGGQFFATLWTIGDYYGPMLVLLYVFFSGLLVVAAMGFTLASLVRTGELTAMVSSGISMHRLAMPVVVIGCLLNAVTVFNQELVIPRLAHKLTRSKSKIYQESLPWFEVRYAVDSQGHLLSASRFEAAMDQPMLTGVTILQRDAQGQAVQRITAEQAFWSPAYQGWELIGGYAIKPAVGPDSGSASGASAVSHEAQPVAFFATDLSPQVLLAQRTGIYPRLLSFPELRDLAANPAVNDGPIRRIMHSRFSLLVMNVLVLVIGLPFFLVHRTVNMLRQGVWAVGVCLLVWGAGVVLPEAVSGYVNPVTSAWLPVVVLLPISAVGLGWIRT